MKKGLKWIIAFIGAALFVLLLRCFAFTSYYIPANGMETSLHCGDRILVNKWSYGLRSPLLSLLPYHRWVEKPVSKEDIVVFNNPANTQAAIDNKEVFISRCIGLPGDTLIVDSVFTLVSPNVTRRFDKAYYFTYPNEKEIELDSLLNTYSMTADTIIEIDSALQARLLPWHIYHNLELNMGKESWLQPLSHDAPSAIHPLIVPGKGSTLKVYPWNRTLLMNTLVLHEERDAIIKNNTLYVDNEPVDSVTFTKDYYWMTSNNTINTSDSRLFGFVPHDHLVGKATSIWFSKEPNTGVLSGYRWNRFFTSVE